MSVSTVPVVVVSVGMVAAPVTSKVPPMVAPFTTVRSVMLAEPLEI